MRVAFLLATAGLLFGQQPPSAPGPQPVRFNRDVLPILSDTCFKCHGPDAKGRKGDLRLDTKDGAFAPLEGGRVALAPRSLAKSELWKRITTADAADLMPPPKSGKSLTPAQKEILRRWIEQGAVWEDHWAYVPLREPPLPRIETLWGRNDVDAFIAERLAVEGLRPSPEADRTTLARRVALDLTGLPPTPAEVEAFVADPAPDAYERLVDRLLASPRYGEHMARFWLDLARYGDTHGLHLDNYREMWPYRDWVIRAFNGNLPFDRFVREQLAGDLLPDATIDQQVASGFNRAHVTTNEGGSIEDEVYCRNVFDRVETFGQVFFAQTFTCARCHDHKFDPVTQKDYYGLFAHFNSLDGPEMDGNRKDSPPFVKVPSPAQADELAKLRAEAAAIEARMDGPHPDLDAQQPAWEAALGSRLAAQWKPLDPESFRGGGGAALREAPDRSIQPEGLRLEYEVAARLSAPAHALLLEVLPPNPEPAADVSLAFSLSELEVELGPDRLALRAAADASAAALLDRKDETAWSGDARKRPGAVLVSSTPFGPGELRIRLVHAGAHAQRPVPRFRLSTTADAELLRGVTPATRGSWHLLGRFPAENGDAAFAAEHGPEKGVDFSKAVGGLKWEKMDAYADGKDLAYPSGIGASYAFRTIQAPTPRRLTFNVSSDDAIQVWLNGATVLSRNVKRTYRKYDANKVTVDLDAGENRLLIKFSNHGTSKDHKFFFDVVDEEAGDLLRDAADALAVEPAKRSDAQKAALRTRHRREVWSEWPSLRRALAAVRGKETALLDRVPVSLVFKEREKPKDAFLLKRGEYDHKGEKIGRATPPFLPPLPKDAPPNRLGLAQWILEPGFPLTARVAVNRFWQQVFGRGLVRTSEDFGRQGEPPSHPELLDWLAARFIADGWDVKRFMRRLLTSATYRQTSKVAADLVRRDPENRLLSRGPRFRMDAETVRDQILFLSGLLVEQVGGPSVKPPQPEGLWEAVGYTGSNTYRFSRDPEPQKVFRRSLYIFWKRTSAPPQMTMFDAPSRESCTARRERTNTPLQALLLMNEPQCFEAARHLAQKAIREGGTTPEARAAWMLRRCTFRPPAERDVADLASLVRSQREVFGKDPEGAKKAVSFGDLPADPSFDAGELAAWTLAASVVLNLDEVLNKR
jgi:hypothetical protein